MPQYEGLAFDDIVKYMKMNRATHAYMPEEREVFKLPKQWVINVTYSVMGSEFSDWVRERIDARNQNIVSDRNLIINMDPQIAEAFKKSTSVSRKLKPSFYLWVRKMSY